MLQSLWEEEQQQLPVGGLASIFGVTKLKKLQTHVARTLSTFCFTSNSSAALNIVLLFEQVQWGGWVMQRCHVSCITGASYWYWLTVGQILLFLQQVRVKGECFYFFCFFTSIHFPLSLLSLSSPLLSLFSFSLGDNTKWPTRVDVSLNPNTNNQMNKSILICQKTTAGWMEFSVDPDQTPYSVESDQGLHYLLRPVCPNN